VKGKRGISDTLETHLSIGENKRVNLKSEWGEAASLIEGYLSASKKRENPSVGK